MANPIEHAKNIEATTYKTIQPYMPVIFKLLANNYTILIFAIVFVNLILLNLMAQFIPLPESTLNVMGFSLMLVVLYYGWRFLESRNHATSLFVLYTRYSSQRRTLKSTIETAEQGALEDEGALYVQADFVEQAANTLLDALEEENIEPIEQKN